MNAPVLKHEHACVTETTWFRAYALFEHVCICLKLILKMSQSVDQPACDTLQKE